MGKSLTKVSIILFTILALVNLIPVLGPEIGFDALWYHLTLPKLYLLQNRWYYPDPLYYSAMPRFIETLFIPLLKFFGTLGPKSLQYLAGLACVYFIYKTGNLFLEKSKSLLAAFLFYFTWLVCWQSGSAYIDLSLTALLLIGVYFSLRYQQSKSLKSFILACIIFSFALGSKWHALPLIGVSSLLTNPLILPVVLLLASPWFYIAYHFTGNPIYPLGDLTISKATMAQVPTDFFSPTSILQRIIKIPYFLTKPFDDPLNPLLGILFLISLFLFFKNTKKIPKLITILTFFGLVFWQLTPPPSSRYFLPYLPYLTLFIAAYLPKVKALHLVILSSFIAITLGRFLVNQKYLPVILGKQSVNQFLTKHSSRLPDTFIDSDDYINANLPKDTKVLVYDLHNLYYFPRNFDHFTWRDKGYTYPYAVSLAPIADKHYLLIHENQLGIKLYKYD